MWEIPANRLEFSDPPRTWIGGSSHICSTALIISYREDLVFLLCCSTIFAFLQDGAACPAKDGGWLQLIRGPRPPSTKWPVTRGGHVSCQGSSDESGGGNGSSGRDGPELSRIVIDTLNTLNTLNTLKHPEHQNGHKQCSCEGVASLRPATPSQKTRTILFLPRVVLDIREVQLSLSARGRRRESVPNSIFFPRRAGIRI